MCQEAALGKIHQLSRVDGGKKDIKGRLVLKGAPEVQCSREQLKEPPEKNHS